jgi:hypothetical protein
MPNERNFLIKTIEKPPFLMVFGTFYKRIKKLQIVNNLSKNTLNALCEIE